MFMLRARLRNRWLRFKARNRDLPACARRNLAAIEGLTGGMNAKALRYVVLDIETTGLDPRHDEIVSLGAIGMQEGRIRLHDHFFELVNPQCRLKHGSIAIHGIVPGRLEAAPRVEEVFPRFLDYLGTAVLVAHHARFDLYFLNKVMTSLYGFPLCNLVLDTARLAMGPLFSQSICLEAGNDPPSLDLLADKCNLPLHERHTSLGDALVTAMIFQRMLEAAEKRGRGSLAELLKESRRAPLKTSGLFCL